MTKSPWCRGWASEQDAKEIDRFKQQVRTLAIVSCTILLVGFMAHSCVDAVVQTTENQSLYYSKPCAVNNQVTRR